MVLDNRSMALLSIIIPHHNAIKSLMRLLSSIPKCDWIEIIIIDDMSEDTAVNKLTSIAALDSRIKLLFLGEGKRWAGAARNLGIAESRADWLLFADSDDYFLPDLDKKIYPYLSKQIDVVYFSPTSIREGGGESRRHVRYKEIISQYSKSHDHRLLYAFSVPWSKLIYRPFIVKNNIRFDQVVASNDVVFSLKLAFYSNKVLCEFINIYCVTDSELSLTKSKSYDVLESRYLAACRYNDFLLKNDPAADLAPMSGHIWSARHIGLLKIFMRTYQSLKNGYPIFNDFTHFIKSFAKVFHW